MSHWREGNPASSSALGHCGSDGPVARVIGLAFPVIFAFLVLPAPGPASEPTDGPRGTVAIPSGGLATNSFIENRGQVGGEVRFYAPGNPSIAIRDDGILFLLREPRQTERAPGEPSSIPAPPPHSPARRFAYLVRFVGGNHPTPVGVDHPSLL